VRIALSAFGLSMIIMISTAGGVAIAKLSEMNSSSSAPFAVNASSMSGVNEYILIEIDEGDNDEEEVITTKLHEFFFESLNAQGMVTWDFGDGSFATGKEASHSYDDAGYYTVTATSTSSRGIELATIIVMVEKSGYVESDNMECACSPTAKSTIIGLVPVPGMVNFEGVVTVTHDGSSESCSLRNPFQECHLRVIIEYTKDGNIMEQQILFDDTFRTNEKNIEFELIDFETESGESVQIRLETDQLRDWHKPSTSWTMTAPIW
tara:strand:- start:1172 stop:1963 length:792 start_codon:yes stop_codon:yes gene_type:complete